MKDKLLDLLIMRDNFIVLGKRCLLINAKRNLCKNSWIPITKRRRIMICPNCGKPGRVVYQCSACSEIRCSSPKCPGTAKIKTVAAANNVTCKVCKKGKYRKLG